MQAGAAMTNQSVRFQAFYSVKTSNRPVRMRFVRGWCGWGQHREDN